MFTSELSSRQVTLLWLTLWAAIVVSFCISLPGFAEYDTEKYLTISRSMLLRHDYVLAYWQGHLYSDKPPLMFWLIVAGWKLFGMSNWWPQLLVLSFATGSIIVTQKLATLLWPENNSIAKITPFILIGCFYWVWFAKQIRVDSILVLASVLSLYFACKTLTHSKKYWLGYALSVGIGGFAKGPVILVFILLPTLFLPGLIDKQKTPFSPGWYGMLGLMTIVGLGLTMAWAVPAAIKGGDIFKQEIFYQQITKRAHQHQLSAWFYLSRLPLWLLPWTIYPPLWQGLMRAKKLLFSPSVLICLIALSAALIVFSVFGQKLPHYIYPIFPIFALLIAFFCSQSRGIKTWHQWPMAGLLFLFAVLCLGFSFIHQLLPYAAAVRTFFIKEIHLITWGLLFLMMAGLLVFFKPSTKLTQIIIMTVSAVLIAAFINDILLWHYRQHLPNQIVPQSAQLQPNYSPYNSLPKKWYYASRYSITAVE